MILASCPKEGLVLDPFMGSGTTAISCIKNNRNYIGFELNKKYCSLIENRIRKHITMQNDIEKQQLLNIG
jgi:site-specific DNA-methyltransferase (adenine-specific)